MPCVNAVVTGAELAAAGLKPIPAAAPFKWSDGSEQRQASRLSLAHEVVRHVGEPVALVGNHRDRSLKNSGSAS